MSLLSLLYSGARIVLGALGLLGRLEDWLRSRAKIRQDAETQAAAETAAAERTETGIAQAEAGAPRTDDAVDARLREHSI